MGIEQYITQMATSVVDAPINPLWELFQYSTSYFGRNNSNFICYHFLLKASRFLGRFWNTLDFRCPHRKRLQGVNLGGHGGHLISLHKDTMCPGNVSLRISSEQWYVCDVAPSCWNQTFLTTCSLQLSTFS